MWSVSAATRLTGAAIAVLACGACQRHAHAPHGPAPSGQGLTRPDEGGFAKTLSTQPFEDFVDGMKEFFRIGTSAEEYADALAQADAVTEMDAGKLYLFRFRGNTFAREGPQGVRVMVGPRSEGEASVILSVRRYVTRR